MVRFMAMVLPSLISIKILEKLDKKEYTGLSFFRTLGAYMLWNNFFALVISTYVLKIGTGIFDSFGSNEFLIHYLIITILLAIVLPIIVVLIKPHINMYKRAIKDRNKDDEKQKK